MKGEKYGNCIQTELNGEHGIYRLTTLENGIYKAESINKNGPQKTKSTLTFRQSRDGIEILEATTKKSDGSTCILKKEEDEYGFETGMYTLTQILKNGKQKTVKVLPGEIKTQSGLSEFADATMFKVRDVTFLTDVGLKSIIY